MIFFCTVAGRDPAREQRRGMPPDERRIIGEDLKILQFRRPAGTPLVRPFGDGLWEPRTRLPTRIARCLSQAPA
ncbi:MAG: hypothetical protein ACKVYV_17695 [Limisphaerales bacterium]